MRTFKDTEGRDWALNVTVADVEDIFDATGIDLGDPKAVERVFESSKTFLNVLSILIREQLVERKLDAAVVKRAFDADVFADAQAKVMEEVVFFIPSRHRPKAEKLLAAIRARHTAVVALADHRLDAAVAKIEAGEMDKAMGLELPPDAEPAPPSSNTATASAASSDSAPAPSPSAS